MKSRNCTAFALCLLALTALSTATAFGDTLITATQRGDHKISLVNLTTNTVTPVCLLGNINPDSLLLYPHGGVLSYIYSASDTGQVRMCTPPSGGGVCDATAGGQTCDVPIATGLLSGQIGQLQDMVLDPPGVANALGYTSGSLLVSDDYNGVTRVDLAGVKAPAVLIPPSSCSNPQGIAYDGNNNLFVNCGFGSTGAGTFQFNPQTGASLNRSNAGYDSTNTPDGLIYDPLTKLLYATSECGGYIYSINPSTLAATQMANSSMPVNGCPDRGPDGLITNGRGFLYIANRGDFHVYSYDAVNKTSSTQLTSVSTLDDLGIAPAQPPNVVKTFASRSITTAQATTMTFTVSNPNPTTDLLNVVLTDSLPSPLVIPNPPGATGSCLGLTGAALVFSPASPPSTGLTLTIPTLAANTSCTLTVNVGGTAQSTGSPACTISPLPTGLGNSPVMNTASVVSANAGPPQTGSDCIGVGRIVPVPPTISKQFNPATSAPGACVAANFTITNVDANYVDAVQVSDTLPAGMTLCASPAPTGSCLTTQSGTLTYSPSAGTTPAAPLNTDTGFSLSIPALPIGGSCILTVSMQASATGSYTNTTAPITATTTAGSVSGQTATSILVVQLAPPTLNKQFMIHNVTAGQVVPLSFVVSNPTASPISGIMFGDVLPGSLLIATPNGLVNGCTGSTVTAAAGTQNISMSGLTLAAGASCTILINVQTSSAGTFINTTSNITSSTPVTTGGTSTDTLIVTLPTADSSYQINYATDLNVGDSYVNITNVGALAGNDPAGTICANVYVFDPAEEPVSCCTCPITPNGLRSLSVQRDLIGNTFTPSVPNAAVIKLVASTPANGSCNAAAVNSSNLVRGMAAWRSTLHTGPSSPATYQNTETPFVWSYLSATELQKLSSVCGFIQTFGSGYGLCNACKPGAQGASKQP